MVHTHLGHTTVAGRRGGKSNNPKQRGGLEAEAGLAGVGECNLGPDRKGGNAFQGGIKGEI